MMIEPKPCPFCGETPELQTGGWHYHETCYYVECLNRDCSVNPCTDDFGTEAEAIEAWNTRTRAFDSVETAQRIAELELELVDARTKRTCKLGAEVPAFDMTLNMLADIPWYWCSECGAATPSISNYCMHCGAKVVG